MIPSDAHEWIFPRIADGTKDAAVLQHDCGIDFQFHVDSMGGEQYVVTHQHLKTWRTKLEQLAEFAGENCFGYNTLPADPAGMYHDTDGNTFAILFAPGTFLEHNEVEGQPLLLVISESECILTGSRSEAGRRLIKQHLPGALARRVVTIDSRWRQWVAVSGGE